MKTLATIEYKKNMSKSDMTPIEIVQPEPVEKKGLSSKQILVAVSSLLVVVVVVCGFVAGFYLMKQTSDKHSDNMTKIFELKLKDGDKTVNEKVKTNVYDNTTEEDTKDDKGQDTKIFNDFKKGLTVFVMSGEGAACFVSPMNRSNFDDPKSLEEYMKTHPNPSLDASGAPKQEFEMTPSDNPISDTSFLGANINKMCSGKQIYWMYPKPKNSDDGSRQKRCITYYRLICRYRIIFGRLIRICYRIRIRIGCSG